MGSMGSFMGSGIHVKFLGEFNGSQEALSSYNPVLWVLWGSLRVLRGPLGSLMGSRDSFVVPRGTFLVQIGTEGLQVCPWES